MANFQAYNDRVWTRPALTLTNPATGLAVPIPSGTVFSATVSNPNALGVAMNLNGAFGPNSVPVYTPLVKNSPGISVTYSAPGLTSTTVLVDVVTDPNPPLAITADTTQADGSSVMQTVPAAAGP